MVLKPQSTKGGGGSIKVGATGTISSLMTRELETMRAGPQKLVTSKNKSSSATSASSSAASIPKRLQQTKSFDEVNNGRRYNTVNSRSFGNSHNTTKAGGSRDVHRIPMLGSDTHANENGYRDKPERKGLRAVAIVDVKCNNPDKAWASRPLSSRLRKLGFSKLSETFA
ncbi:uncharacterized protein LOC111787980 [Cucurbita pepo subsp. pepo]|uniref:uncharacterized protein LOC111787980 n=1 Tax=Cucurbita pepo subsp. pepo TaxID=3664 RepID=UPI000C9D2AF6|nr:uncharacterized protein LOC111787980 [Cucurbita pepo subsp. pepo]XP_023523865.1 uncharacterized protein LOC111787980 [Cucurbita pepo subsp. pepo]XP_023523867.1 uncharacterized protein LOC111787980 [Cucurbita pepo subsp. pepo]XP_023523868.1 uncharacterized protein LOC111787980 [Cucurbita pepo subsp. pepo]